MKKETPVKTQKQKEHCCINGCRSCQNCRVAELDEVTEEFKNNSLQLYAREAESYFFYYAPAINNNH